MGGSAGCIGRRREPSCRSFTLFVAVAQISLNAFKTGCPENPGELRQSGRRMVTLVPAERAPDLPFVNSARCSQRGISAAQFNQIDADCGRNVCSARVFCHELVVVAADRRTKDARRTCAEDANALCGRRMLRSCRRGADRFKPPLLALLCTRALIRSKGFGDVFFLSVDVSSLIADEWSA